MTIIYRIYDLNALDENESQGPTTIVNRIHIRKFTDGEVGRLFFPFFTFIEPRWRLIDNLFDSLFIECGEQ